MPLFGKKLLRYFFLFFGLSVFLTIIGIICLIGCYSHISSSVDEFLYSEQNIDLIPEKRVGLVLGTTMRLPGGRINQFFKNRIDAAFALYQAGKVDFLLVSGDNSRKDYDEPNDMRQSLVNMGIPEDRIYCDYAGFRTLDSVIRAKKVFNATEITIISQEFHVERALYIAHQKGMNAMGFIAKDAYFRPTSYTHFREYLARFAALIDVHVINRRPKFLGPKVTISQTTPQSK